MDAERREAITEWDARDFSGGFAGIRRVAGDGFSGAVTDGVDWLFLVDGRAVEVAGADIDAFADVSGTAYEAPDDALPVLFAMQEAGSEPRAKYYTNDTPLTEADRKLSQGGFTGYIELSENVLSGDYYVAYTGGESMAAAFVGNARRLETDDEAFELAADEVGIYTVYEVDLTVRDLPSGGESAAAGGATDAADTEDTAGTEDAGGPVVVDGPGDPDSSEDIDGSERDTDPANASDVGGVDESSDASDVGDVDTSADASDVGSGSDDASSVVSSQPDGDTAAGDESASAADVEGPGPRSTTRLRPAATGTLPTPDDRPRPTARVDRTPQTTRSPWTRRPRTDPREVARAPAARTRHVSGQTTLPAATRRTCSRRRRHGASRSRSPHSTPQRQATPRRTREMRLGRSNPEPALGETARRTGAPRPPAAPTAPQRRGRPADRRRVVPRPHSANAGATASQSAFGSSRRNYRKRRPNGSRSLTSATSWPRRATRWPRHATSSRTNSAG